MDVNELSIRGDVECRKPRLVHTSESSTHNGHVSTINLSYQIVLQDHNYGAPLPLHNNDQSPPYTVQCKQEPSDSHASSVAPVTHSQRVGLKTLTPRPPAISPQAGGRVTKPNGVNSSFAKRQRTSSGNSNGVAFGSNITPPNQPGSRRQGPQGCETPKSHSNLSTPPLVAKGPAGFQYVGDLNSHLYASISNEKTTIKEEPKGPSTTNGTSGLSNYFSGWYRGSGGNNAERVGSRSDMRDSINDEDSNDGSLDNSPRMTNESDHEGEETETAPECEDEEDEQDDVDLRGGREINSIEESVTRCICKFGHDDGYMICCDRCSVWQHVDCMNLDRNNIPDEFLCELCQPRRVDRARARAIQYRKRQEFRLSTPPPSSSPDRGLARSKERTKSEDYIDVEKTPKKIQRTYTTANSGSKYPRGGAKGQSAADRPDKFQRAGKRPVQPKYKRRGSDKQDDLASRPKRKFRSKTSEMIDVGGPSFTANENSPSGGRIHPSGELLLQWIDHYEEAVTNHYSPELRARVAAVRPNGLGGELLSPPSSTPAYRLASKAGGFKTLVAANPIRCGSPLIECRGKYMLASQLRPYKSGDGSGIGGTSGLRPTPHIIFHHLLASSTDNTTPVVEMCVDGRSYGNEARFVWQSCQPNAEIKHKVEKGSVHLYLVAKTDILESEEITVAHDTKNPLPCPYEGCPHMKNKDSGARTGLAPAANSTSTPSPVEVERKRRRRRTNSTAAADTSYQSTANSSLTTPNDTSLATPTSSAPAAQPAVPSTPPTQAALPPTPVKRQQRTPSKNSAVVTEGEDSQDDTIDMQNDADGQGSMDNESSSKKKKLSREERKMEAIMKAFERMEKLQQRRQESVAKTSHRKDSRDGRDDQDMDQSPPHSHGSSLPVEKRAISTQDSRTKTFRRGKRGGRMRRCSSGTGVGENSRIRMRALSGEVHSGHSATEEESEHGGSSSSPSQTNPGTPGDDPSTMAFKCPKTKKVVFNNWSGDSSEFNGNKGDSSDPLSSSNSLSFPTCYMRNPNPRSPTRPLRATHLRYGATSTQQSTPESKPPFNMFLNGCRPSTLASLKSPAGSASPDPHGEGGHSNDENAWAAPLPGSGGGGGAGGSAKKRWLRQAISEETETESPNSGGMNLGGLGMGGILPSNEVLDHVTPLKKRRLARASLSSETSFTPPSTPTPSNVGVVGSNDHVQNDSGLQPLMEKDESNVESLSGENSQEGTLTSECDDVVVPEVSRSQPPVDGKLGDDPPTPPTVTLEQPTKVCVGLSSPPNGYISESTQQVWASRSEEVAQTEAVIGFVSVDDRVNAAAVLTQFQDGGRCLASSPRPTWEFRAPDAQFMRCRNPSDVPDAVATDVTQELVQQEKPKPIKRKLSILEYRQRKQNAFNDGSDTPTKEEPNQNDALRAKRDSIADDNNSDSDPASSTRTKDPPSHAADDSQSKSESTADDSNTSSSFEGDEEPPTSL